MFQQVRLYTGAATINDPETTDYISRRYGTTTVEIDRVSRRYEITRHAGPRSTCCG
ncbi:type IV secretory system conjugative DNA transfer family protein (plasmid) [Rhizobium sp. B21/90]|nr:type IV secretory system conjugative DNA transfer family protein [Rhizobium sp. B21/90]